MTVERLDPHPGEAVADNRMQVGRDRNGHGATGALIGLADEALVRTAGIQQVTPWLAGCRCGHQERAGIVTGAGYRAGPDTLTEVRALYVDLDGTLLGPGGNLFSDADGAFTLQGAKAVEACARAGAEVVVTTGRRAAGAFEIARLIGQMSAVFEAGAGYMLDGEEHWITGEWQPKDGATIFQQVEDAGAPALLLDSYPGRLEPHTPWTLNREVSHLFRGLVDVDEANALLAANDLASLRLLDNGEAHRRSPALADLPYLRCYHLVPATVSKAAGVAAHARARGYAPEDCIAVGDSREDIQMAAVVGSFWLVANAPAIGEELPANARIAEATYGAGVYEAVVTTLAMRTGAR